MLVKCGYLVAQARQMSNKEDKLFSSGQRTEVRESGHPTTDVIVFSQLHMSDLLWKVEDRGNRSFSQSYGLSCSVHVLLLKVAAADYGVFGRFKVLPPHSFHPRHPFTRIFGNPSATHTKKYIKKLKVICTGYMSAFYH